MRSVRDSARAQQAVYDASGRTIDEGIQECILAAELFFRRQLLREALQMMGRVPPRPGERWVYVGGGEGTQCFVLAEHGGLHLSADVSRRQLQKGLTIQRELSPFYFHPLVGRVSFLQVDAEARLPLRDGAADVAYGIGVLNHLDPSSWVSHLSELCRITRSGGLVFHVIPNLECEYYQRALFQRQFADPGSIQYWTQFVRRANVIEAFQKAGFRDVRAEALWRFDHDRFPPRKWWALEFRMIRALRRLGVPFRPRLGERFQRFCHRGAEIRRAWARPWTFQVPRHLCVWGSVINGR